jgi:cytochrome P450
MKCLLRCSTFHPLLSLLTPLTSTSRTVLLAGHETTANTLSWCLLELSHQPHIQTKLRAEIRKHERIVTERGDEAFGWKDFEDMQYLNAVIKVRS